MGQSTPQSVFNDEQKSDNANACFLELRDLRALRG